MFREPGTEHLVLPEPSQTTVAMVTPGTIAPLASQLGSVSLDGNFYIFSFLVSHLFKLLMLIQTFSSSHKIGTTGPKFLLGTWLLHGENSNYSSRALPVKL